MMQLEEQRAKKEERIREQVQKEHEEKLGSAEEISGEQASAAAVSTTGEVVDQVSTATATVVLLSCFLEPRIAKRDHFPLHPRRKKKGSKHRPVPTRCTGLSSLITGKPKYITLFSTQPRPVGHRLTER